jgi:photosystem II stability/assembly factor-like uncharacterized protein
MARLAPVVAAITFLMPVAATVGASPSSPPTLDITSYAASWLPAPPQAPNWGPGPDERGLLFTQGGTGFLVSSQSLVPTGAGSVAEVQRTRDQGKSWTTVWRRSRVSLSWVGTLGSEVIAAGISLVVGQPFLIESSDGGATWQTVQVALSPDLVPGVENSDVQQALWSLWAFDQFDFVTPSLGFAMPDSMTGQAAFMTPGPLALLRTTDGGRKWSRVALPGGVPTGGLAFVGNGRGFATGSGSKCLGQIWQTSDSGLAWSPVPGTCVDDWLDALSFPTPSEGYAGGGDWAKYTNTGRQQLDLFRTTDGGEHWAKVYQSAGPPGPALDYNPFGEVDFVTLEKGFALDGGQTAGAGGPIGGHLWITTDGGRHWSEQAVAGLRLVVDGSHGVWLMNGGPAAGGDVVLRSEDGGRTWSEVGNPARTAVLNVAGSGRELWVNTEAGEYISHDGGRTWYRPPAAMGRVSLSSDYGSSLSFGPGGLAVILNGDDDFWVSDDGGRTGKTVKVPILAQIGIVAVAFANARDGLVVGSGQCGSDEVLATSDGGRSWHKVGETGVLPISFAFDGPLAVAAGCPGNEISASYDQGRTWYDLPLGNELSTSIVSVSVAGDSVAVLCYLIPSGREYMLFSANGGRQWARLSFSGPGAKTVPGALVLTSPRSVWAYGPPGILWHSTNAGRTWSAVRLFLPLVP